MLPHKFTLRLGYSVSEFYEAATQVVTTVGLIIVYIERRLTKLETKISPLWREYQERRVHEN